MIRARAITGGQAFVPYSTATLDVDFASSGYVGISGPSALTVVRTGAASSSLFTDATGSSYTSYPANLPRIISGSGLLVEEGRTNYLGVTDAPATQTTASLGTGSYTLWVIGSGSATSSAGTATITGGGAATAGTPNVFTVTVAGTVTVTVSGSLTRFQLENGAFATSYIPNPGAAGTSAARGGESVRLTSTNFSSWFTGGSSGTFLWEGNTRNNSGGAGNRRAFEVNNGSTDNRIFAVVNSSNQWRVGWTTSTTPQADITLTSPTFAGTTFRAAARYATNSFQIAANGTLATADVSGTPPTTLDQIQLGNDFALTLNNYQNGFTKRLIYVPSALSDAALQAWL